MFRKSSRINNECKHFIMGVHRYFSVPYNRGMLDIIKNLCENNNYMFKDAIFTRDMDEVNRMQFQISNKDRKNLHVLRITPDHRLLSIWDGSKADLVPTVEVLHFFDHYFHCKDDTHVYLAEDSQEEKF